MKKYIAALLTLLCLSGCNVREGQTPTPDGGKKAIWEEVYRALYKSCSYGYYALYGEALMTDNQDVANFLKSNVGVVDGTSVEVAADKIVITNVVNDYTRTHIIVTEGKKLSEGATWKLYYKIEYNTEIEPTLVATFVGKQGSDDSFTCRCEWEEQTYYYCSGKVDSDLNYTVSVLESKVEASLSSTGRLYQDNDCTIDLATVEHKPVVFGDNMLRSGAVDILYKDLERKSSKAFVVEVVSPATGIHDFYETVVYTDK